MMSLADVYTRNKVLLLMGLRLGSVLLVYLRIKGSAKPCNVLIALFSEVLPLPGP